MLIAALAAVSLALDPMVRVEGVSVCPTVEEVQAELFRLSGRQGAAAGATPAPDARADVAVLRSTARWLHVELHRPDGTLVGEKDLELRSRCGELARTVAVVIAAWESRLRFEATSVSPPANDIPSVSAAECAKPPARLDVTRTPPPAPPIVPAVASSSRQPTATWGLELGLGASLVLPAARPGAQLYLAARKDETPWLAHLIVDASTWHSAAFGAGTGKWTRVVAGLGAGYAWRRARLTAQVEANLLGAATLASAQGFGAAWTVRRQTAFEPGVGAGIRLLGPRRSPVGAWLAVEGAFWPRAQELISTDPNGGVVDRLVLPRLDLSLAIGGSLPGPL